MSALRAGRHDEWAKKADDAAKQFIGHFGYGEEGRKALSVCYRMAQMDDTSKSLWMEVGK